VTTITQQQRFIKAPMLMVKCVQDAILPTHLRAHVQLRFDMLDPTKSTLPLLSFAMLPVFFTCMFLLYNRSSTGIIWFACTIVPSLGIIQHGYVCFGADRLWHFALVPLSAALGSASMWYFQATSKKATTKTNRLSPCDSHVQMGGVVAFFLLGLSCTTSFTISNWRNDEVLWLENLRVDPSDWRARDQIIEYYVGQNNFEAARPHLLTLELFSPRGGLKAELHRAKLLVMQGMTDDACSLYKNLIASASFETSPARGSIYNNNGVCCLHQNRLKKALAWFAQGLASTTYERHRATLHYNQQEVLRVMKDDPGGLKVYAGQHSLIF
jgi:tetratricopeptide (TPR) repeat protein